MKEKLYLGVAETVITPKIGCHLYGYAPDVISNAVHDDLTATAFYFKQGDKAAMIISTTVCSIRTDVCDELRGLIAENCGISADFIQLHCTHTHSGPALSSGAGWGDMDREYYSEIFEPRVIAVCKEAMTSPIPVKMGVAEGESYIGVNRREADYNNKVWLGQNPWGPFDPRMVVISFEDYDGTTVANIVHYGMHGTCAGRNLEISRDWAGVMTDVMKKETGAMTAFLNGPEGDVGPRLTNGKTTGICDITYAERHGALAAADAMRVYRSIREYYVPDMELLCTEVKIPLEKRISFEEAREGFAQYEGNTFNILAGKAAYYKRQIELYEQGYEEAEARVLPQTVMRLGGVAFVSSQFELFSEIGLRISKYSPVPYTLMTVNTNGQEKYFVTQGEIGRGGYEVEMFKTGYTQPYADDSDWHYIKQTVENLKSMNYGREE
ncbi:MAG: neutral/alkaline non-lysosomal ceramidase N-terminal domain-containing protein [Clostridia bacterium]|nr:neutral/alkaline non-lysosomal ceramidase N-terminal domain-containing protein [Clostridia bacterium]